MAQPGIRSGPIRCEALAVKLCGSGEGFPAQPNLIALTEKRPGRCQPGLKVLGEDA